MTALDARVSTWHVPRAIPSLDPGTVHVWRASVSVLIAHAPYLEALLSPDESATARRFHHESDASRYVVAHGALRFLLGAYEHIDPRAVAFKAGPYGKPRLAHASSLCFNLSHSGDYVVIAAARGGEVGVDVEHWSEFDYNALAAYVFAPAERAALGALPSAMQPCAFFACWSRKEAYIKATGVGVAEGLDHFEVTLTPGDNARLVGDRRTPAATLRWFMHDIDLGAGYSAALVTDGNGWDVVRLKFVTELLIR